ncbi:cellulase family glycosylhydrolase [bacterium]
MNKKIQIIIISFILFSTFLGCQEYPGFSVKGRHLYTPCGDKVILRGVSNPNIWFQRNGMPPYEEIEKSGANVVRIVWQIYGSAEQLDEAILNCYEHKMIPMIECHDATGNWAMLDEIVDYWTREDVADVIIDHEKYLLLNIANEAGDYALPDSTFRNDYEMYILKIREAGIHVPLIIDATNWGKNINVLQAKGPELIETDPDHNLMFSVHMWWPSMYGYDEQDIIDEIRQSVTMELPLIVGEFGQMHGDCSDVLSPDKEIAYLTIIEQCHLNEIGYIAWSWFGNCNSLWDITKDGTYDTLYDWGLEVTVTHKYSIQNTSVRPDYIINGDCESIIRGENETDLKKHKINLILPKP